VRGGGEAAIWLPAAVIWFGSSCNFDAAFARYCSDNPRCQGDAAGDWQHGPAGSAATDEAGGEVSSEGGLETEAAVLPTMSCATDDNCAGPGQICRQHMCMTTCSGNGDCTLGNDTCFGIAGLGPGLLPGDCLPGSDACDSAPVGLCVCVSSYSCQSVASGFLCNPIDRLCEAPCYETEDCATFVSPRACDTDDHFCKPTCSSNASCPDPYQPRCDPTTGLCGVCVEAADCSSRPDGLTECGSFGACVSPS
jgi:hypothetical protein